jgi:hypothetical protein
MGIAFLGREKIGSSIYRRGVARFDKGFKEDVYAHEAGEEEQEKGQGNPTEGFDVMFGDSFVAYDEAEDGAGEEGEGESGLKVCGGEVWGQMEVEGGGAKAAEEDSQDGEGGEILFEGIS